MHEYARIEEPPLIPRTGRVKPARRGAGPFTGWRPRLSTPSLDLRGLWKPGPAKAIALGLAAATVIGLQAWTLHSLTRVRSDLAGAGKTLAEARASLAMLWDITEQLDEDQMAGLRQLADSVRSVFAYAQGEIRLWETAFEAQDQRLNENVARIGRNGEAITRVATATRAVNGRLDQLGRADDVHQGRLDELSRTGEAHQSRLVALERQDRTQGAAVEALARRAEAQEASFRGTATTVGSLRETLAALDGELAGLEQRVETAGSAYGQVNTRLDRLNGWVEEFRRAGLSGEAVDGRLTALADELRRVRQRVDSLRTARPAVAPAANDD